jgi:hypothetical protein
VPATSHDALNSAQGASGRGGFSQKRFHAAAFPFMARASNTALHTTGSKKTNLPIVTLGIFRSAWRWRSHLTDGRHSGAKRISSSLGASTYWASAGGGFTDSTCDMIHPFQNGDATFGQPLIKVGEPVANYF